MTDEPFEPTPDELSQMLAWPYDPPRIYRCIVCHEIKNTAYDVPCGDCAGLCARFGTHFFQIRGRKRPEGKRPYEGQPCVCGKTTFSKAPPHARERGDVA